MKQISIMSETFQDLKRSITSNYTKIVKYYTLYIWFYTNIKEPKLEINCIGIWTNYDWI